MNAKPRHKISDFHWARILLVAWFVAIFLLPNSSRLLPSRLWFDAGSITVADGIVGHPIVMDFDRTIYWPFWGTYSSVLRKVDEVEGFVTYCSTDEHSLDYAPDAALPNPLTMDWWMWPDLTCRPNSEGRFKLYTIWRIQVFGKVLKTIRRESNIFTVRMG